MSQTADWVMDHSPVDESRADSGEPSLRWLILPAVLAVGWGTFFGLSAVFLADEPLSRGQSGSGFSEAQDLAPPLVMLAEPRKPISSSPLSSAAPPSAPWRDVDPLRSPRGEPAAMEAPVAVASAAPETPAIAEAAKAPALAIAAPRPPGEMERAGFVGTWGPTQAACQAPARRRGYIPATITMGGAKAGRTICSFKDSHRSGNGWTMTASCSERGRRWSSQVRLVVDGNRLTWSSGKGDAAYIRCGRREG